MCVYIYKCVYVYICVHEHVCVYVRICRADGSSPAAPVLATPDFVKIKLKFHFYKTQVMSKSASVNFGVVRLIILSYNRLKKHIKKCNIIGHPHIQFIVFSKSILLHN